MNDLNPEILDTNPRLFFHLQQQRLIELIRSGDLDAALDFAQVLFSLLDQEIDNNKFEDELRVLLGTSSYSLFTMDKLVCQLVKQCQILMQDEVCMSLLSLYQQEHFRCQNALVNREHTLA